MHPEPDMRVVCLCLTWNLHLLGEQRLRFEVPDYLLVTFILPIALSPAARKLAPSLR